MIRNVLKNRQIAYLRQHYGRADEVQLAKTLGLTEIELTEKLKESGIRRTTASRKLSVPAAAAELPPFRLGLMAPASATLLCKRDYLLAATISLFALAIYLLTLGPTVTGEDSGELIAAAYTMGIPHPPGYPTWTMLGKIFTMLPVGNVAWRVNLMSAVFAALSVGLTMLLARKLSLPLWAVSVGGMAFAFSRELWEQAVIAEVYTLNAFFFVACILCLVVWYESRSASSLLVFSALYGLSLGNHNTMALLGPVFLVFILLMDWTPWRRWPLYVGAGVTSLGLAALVHAYLPIRSAANPPVDWGNPETWENFLDVVTRAQYSFMFTEDPRTLSLFGSQLLALFRNYLEQFSPWLGIAALPGVFLLALRDRARGGLLLVILLSVTFGYLLILNTRMEREAMWVSTVFYIPAWLLLAVGLAESLTYLRQRLPTPPRAESRHWAIIGALLAASIVSPLYWNYSHNDRSDYRYTHDFAKNILSTLEPNAIYFPSADHATFPVMYLQAVEGMRPDVTIANKYGYPEPELYREMPGASEMPAIPSITDEALIEKWVIQNAGRPVYFSARRDMGDLPGYTLQEEGLLFRVIKPDEERPPTDYWAAYSWDSLDESKTAGELTADYVLSDVFYMQGRSSLAKGEQEDGLALFDRVAAINMDNKETLNNLGSTCAEKGLLDAAAKYLELALIADPSYPTALINLAKVNVEQGEHAKAILRLEELLKVDAKNGEAVRISADSLVAIQWYDEAIQRYEYLVSLTPGDASAYKALGDLYWNHRKDQSAATRYYSASLHLNPEQPEIQEKLTKSAEPEVPGLPEVPQLPEVPNPMEKMPGLPTNPIGAGIGTPGLDAFPKQ